MRGGVEQAASQLERVEHEAACGWGFAIDDDLLDEARKLVAEVRQSDTLGQTDWHKKAFEVTSRLIFTGVAAYYEAPLGNELPPLAEGVVPDDAMQTIGLGLTLWVGKILQGRSPEELRDLGHYLDISLREPHGSQPPQLLFPLDATTAQRIDQQIQGIKQASDAQACRDRIREAVIEIGVATVEAYYLKVGEDVADPAHYRQVVLHGTREAEHILEEILDQMLPSFPHAHLVHFAYYVESMMRMGGSHDQTA